MVGLKRIDDNTLEIKRLQIAANHQGKGLGRMLMKHVLEYAHLHNKSSLCLDVSEPQTKAKNFYLSMGFKIVHIENRVLGPDNEKFISTYMQKDL